jgi:hypothetical protein
MYHQYPVHQNPLMNIQEPIETTFNYQRLKNGYFAFRRIWRDGAEKLTIGLINGKLYEFYLNDAGENKVEIHKNFIESVSAENLSANDWLYATDPMGFNVLKNSPRLTWGVSLTDTDLFTNLFKDNPPC